MGRAIKAVPVGKRPRDHLREVERQLIFCEPPTRFELPTNLFEVSRDGIRKWRWLYSIQKTRAAYDAARAGALENMKDILSFVAEHAKSEPDRSDEDWDDWQTYSEHLSDQIYEIESVFLNLRNAFSLILYHSWERHAVRWIDWKGRYHIGNMTPRLRAMNYKIDPGIHILASVANTIKHNSAELWKKNSSMFREKFEDEINDDGEADYMDGLRLSDDDMLKFFVSLEKSGPPGPATPSL